MVIRDVERDDIEFISKTLGCLPMSHIDHMKPEKLGTADLVEEVECGKGKIVKVSGITNQGRTATVLLRGSNKMVLEEAERSLHDALCVIRWGGPHQRSAFFFVQLLQLIWHSWLLNQAYLYFLHHCGVFAPGWSALLPSGTNHVGDDLMRHQTFNTHEWLCVNSCDTSSSTPWQ